MRNSLVLIALFAISACSGGGGDPFVVSISPQSTSGFAQSGDRVIGGTTYTVSDASFLRADLSGVSTTTLPITYSIAPDGLSVTVTLNGTVENLFSVGGGRYESSDGDLSATRILSNGTLSAQVVESVYVFQDTGPGFDVGYVTFGFDTDPADLAQKTGTATYLTDVSLLLLTSTDFTFADGTGSLVANFGNDTVSGSMVATPFGTNSLGITGPISISLPATAISGNGFTGEANINVLSSGVFVDDASVSGRFYGDEAQAIGGQIWGVGLDGPNTLVIQGGFVGE